MLPRPGLQDAVFADGWMKPPPQHAYNEQVCKRCAKLFDQIEDKAPLVPFGTVPHSKIWIEGDEVLFATYAFTGLRRSEALALRITDFDRTLQQFTLRHTKGGGCRVQPVPAILVDLLVGYIQGFDRTSAVAKPSAFLLPGRGRQTPVSVRLVQARFQVWKRAAKIRDTLTVHSFRAGFATRLYRATGDIRLVGRALGHSHLLTTQRYVAADESEIRAAMERTFGYG